MTEAESRQRRKPVDPNEPLPPPLKRIPKYADNLETGLVGGTAGAAEIRAALAREPERSQRM